VYLPLAPIRASNPPRPHLMLKSCWFHRTRHDSEQMVAAEPPSGPRINTQPTRAAGTAWDGSRPTRDTRCEDMLPEPPVDATRRRTMPSNCAARTRGIPEGGSCVGRSACRGSWSSSSMSVDSMARRGWNSSGRPASRARPTITSTTLRRRAHATQSRGTHVAARPPVSGPAPKAARSRSRQPFSVRRFHDPNAPATRPRFDDWPFHVSQPQRSGPRAPLRSRSYLALRGE